MMKTKFSKKHIHILDSLLKKLYSLSNSEPTYSFAVTNPLLVFVHEKTVIVRFNCGDEFSKFYGKAVCDDTDTFDLQTGVKIARTKLLKTLMISMKKEFAERIVSMNKTAKSFAKFFNEAMEESNKYIESLSPTE